MPFRLVKLRQCDSNDPLRALGKNIFNLPFLQHLKAVVCPAMAVNSLPWSLEAKVAFGSSVPISPETTEWRTQSVQLHSQSPKEAFLQGSLDNGFTWAVF